ASHPLRSCLGGQVAHSRASLNPMNPAQFGASSGVPGKLRPKRALVDVFYVDDVDTSIHDRSRFFVRYGTNENQHGSFPRLDRNLSNALVSADGAGPCLTAIWAKKQGGGSAPELCGAPRIAGSRPIIRMRWRRHLSSALQRRGVLAP